MTQTAGSGYWWHPTAALDATRIGGQQYGNAEVREVMQSLQHTTYARPLNNASIALQTGVPGRTIRQIVSDLDGRVMLIGKRSSGMFVCHYADEAAEYTGALDKHWKSERERVRRRRAFTENLPRRQGLMFDNFDADLLEDDDEDY